MPQANDVLAQLLDALGEPDLDDHAMMLLADACEYQADALTVIITAVEAQICGYREVLDASIQHHARMQVERDAERKTAADLESRLNDAYYEADCLRDERDRLASEVTP